MELQQINQRIAVVNSESKRLNSERQMLIGKRQTLETQLSDLIAAYKKDYGVELTIDTIDGEIARVSALKEGELSGIETMLNLIKSGQYEEAERLANQGKETVVASGVTEAEPQTPPWENPGTPVQAEVAETASQTPPAPAPVQPPVAEAPAPVQPPVTPPQEAPVAPEAPPAAPPAPPTFSRPADDIPAPPPAAPPTFAPPATPTGDTPPAPPAPPPTINRGVQTPAGAPKIGVPPAVGVGGDSKMSFQAILSGKAFNPQIGG